MNYTNVAAGGSRNPELYNYQPDPTYEQITCQVIERGESSADYKHVTDNVAKQVDLVRALGNMATLRSDLVRVTVL